MLTPHRRMPYYLLVLASGVMNKYSPLTADGARGRHVTDADCIIVWARVTHLVRLRLGLNIQQLVAFD
jgi:hypothetical protein